MSPRVLYLVYWGAAEPLGRSLVLPTVTWLARRGVRIDLVSFEKPADLADLGGMDAIRDHLQQVGVRWFPLRYHKRPKLPATAFDVAQAIARGLACRFSGPIDIIHARTFVCGPMGLALSSLLRVPLVYHNEGFYPDEQVDGGIWQAGSRIHRLARSIEAACYARSAGIVALSHRARGVIEAMPVVRDRGTPITVVPSTVDLDHFRPGPRTPAPMTDDALRLVYIGSVGGRYILEAAGRFAAVAREVFPRLHLRVLSPASPDLVAARLGDAGLPAEAWSLGRLPHEQMPAELPRHHAGLFFLTWGLSEHGCSPTKIGEYWASGLPVVTTSNVSDTDQLIERHQAGVVIHEHSDDEYRRAAARLRELLADPGTPGRCRRAAEEHYSLDAAGHRLLQLYDAVCKHGASGRSGCGMLTD